MCVCVRVCALRVIDMLIYALVCVCVRVYIDQYLYDKLKNIDHTLKHIQYMNYFICNACSKAHRINSIRTINNRDNTTHIKPPTK